MAFDEVKKNFGFGCMRLPMCGDKVDEAAFCEMADAFLAAGFNYFDTAHGYLDGKSETAIRECVSKRHPRDRFVLTDKLTETYFERQEDVRPFFQRQLEACGVEYFDFYLMHAQNAENYKKYQACHAYETAQELKKEGKVRHVGLSFHDKASVLDRILTDHPQVEVVQIQFNYLDYDDAGVQGRECYEVCRRHGKPVIVMEPVKGGTLADPPPAAWEILNGLKGGTPASYAIRYAAGFDGVFMVLSGMSNQAQMADNLSFMSEFRALSSAELAALERVKQVIRSIDTVACTGCRYCTEGCPQKIAIPHLFADLNAKRRFRDWNSDYYYGIHTAGGGKASDCIGCGKCEKACPQHLDIRNLLKAVAEEFEH